MSQLKKEGQVLSIGSMRVTKYAENNLFRPCFYNRTLSLSFICKMYEWYDIRVMHDRQVKGIISECTSELQGELDVKCAREMRARNKSISFFLLQY